MAQCNCKKTAAKDCPNGQCGDCCSGCIRHDTREKCEGCDEKLKRIFVNNVNVVTDVVTVPSVQIANVRTLIGCAIVVQNTVIYATALRMLQLVPVMFVTLVQVV
jgi:hypothetical protein